MRKSFFSVALLLSLGYGLSTANASYTDVPTDSPYKDGVDFLELLGATQNKLLFHPTAKVTKAEFYKILFKVFQEEPRGKQNGFQDVPEDAWFAPYAKLAQSNELEEGTLFEPGKNLSKIEVLKKLLEAYGITGGVVPWFDRVPLFADVPINHPYYSVIARLVNEGILSSNSETSLEALFPLTRGDLANTILEFETWHNKKVAVEQSYFYKSDIFADIWNKIMSDYYLPAGQEIDPDALFQAAIKGMLTSLNDPFTTYFTPDQSNEFSGTLNGNFEGIGAYLNQDEVTGTFTFSAFIPGSPAELSDLEMGDLITEIDGVEITGMTLDQVIARIKGAAGTKVRLTVERKGQSITYELTRAAVQVHLVSGSILDKKSWLIDIDSFGASTVEEFLSTIETLKKEVEEPKAIVLDLRSNGGGYISSANQVTGNFVPYLTKLVDLDYGDFSESTVNGDLGIYQGIPLYILVNQYTASASEILAQDLKEVANAVVIGTQTYGKGSAQTLTEYWDGSELKITIAHWLSSKGTSIHGIGVTPNILIQADGTSSEDLWVKAAEKAIDAL